MRFTALLAVASAVLVAGAPVSRQTAFGSTALTISPDR